MAGEYEGELTVLHNTHNGTYSAKGSSFGISAYIIQCIAILALLVYAVIQFCAFSNLKTSIANNINDINGKLHALDEKSDEALTTARSQMNVSTYMHEDGNGWRSSGGISPVALDDIDNIPNSNAENTDRNLTSDKYDKETYNDIWSTEKVAAIRQSFSAENRYNIGLSEQYASVILEDVDCKSTTCKISLNYSNVPVGEEAAIGSDIMKIMLTRIHGCGFTIVPIDIGKRTQELYLECKE